MTPREKRIVEIARAAGRGIGRSPKLRGAVVGVVAALSRDLVVVCTEFAAPTLALRAATVGDLRKAGFDDLGDDVELAARRTPRGSLLVVELTGLDTGDEETARCDLWTIAVNGELVAAVPPRERSSKGGTARPWGGAEHAPAPRPLSPYDAGPDPYESESSSYRRPRR